MEHSMNQADAMTHPPSAHGQAAPRPSQGAPHRWDDTDEEFMQLVRELQTETVDILSADSRCAIDTGDNAPDQC
jgi:hypothetical protein